MTEDEKKLAAMIAIALKVFRGVDAVSAINEADFMVNELRKRGWTKALDL